LGHRHPRSLTTLHRVHGIFIENKYAVILYNILPVYVRTGCINVRKYFKTVLGDKKHIYFYNSIIKYYKLVYNCVYFLMRFKFTFDDSKSQHKLCSFANLLIIIYYSLSISVKLIGIAIMLYRIA